MTWEQLAYALVNAARDNRPSCFRRTSWGEHGGFIGKKPGAPHMTRLVLCTHTKDRPDGVQYNDWEPHSTHLRATDWELCDFPGWYRDRPRQAA